MRKTIIVVFYRYENRSRISAVYGIYFAVISSRIKSECSFQIFSIKNPDQEPDMKEVVLQIPTLGSEQNIEIEVRINGKKRTLHYRVEIVDWETEDESTEDKVSVLKRVIKEHDRDWQLIQIGIPTIKNIPIMFRKKEARQP